ncbi:MAG: UbiA family prenyltransferase [Rhodoglobus sp.]
MNPSLPALLRATHLGASVAVTAVGVVLGLGVGLEPWRVVLFGFALLAHQFSVGWSNDWLDAERDQAVGRTDKPLVSGVISVRTVRTAAIVALLLALVLTLPLGWAATLAHALFIACGWGYNLGLKGTPFSVAAYAIGFGTLPLVVTLALPQPALAAPWAIAAAALLGCAAHFANVLPDLEDDAVTGVRGLPQLLGARWSGALMGVALLAAAALVLFGPGSVDFPRVIAAASVALAALVGTLLAVTSRSRRLLFPLILISAVGLVALLALSGSRLLA